MVALGIQQGDAQQPSVPLVLIHRVQTSRTRFWNSLCMVTLYRVTAGGGGRSATGQRAYCEHTHGSNALAGLYRLLNLLSIDFFKKNFKNTHMPRLAPIPDNLAGAQLIDYSSRQLNALAIGQE